MINKLDQKLNIKNPELALLYSIFFAYEANFELNILERRALFFSCSVTIGKKNNLAIAIMSSANYLWVLVVN